MSTANQNPASPGRPVDWAVSRGLVDYAAAVRAMEVRAEAISQGQAAELIWLLEHPPLYSAGTSAREADLVQPDRFPVHRTGRGGQFTYHGPGQRVIYVMLDVKARAGDVRQFVVMLENWIAGTLAQFGVHAEPRADRIGVWVRRPEKGEQAEDKIAAIGLRLRRWVSLHGISLNVSPDLDHYAGIVPCGISGFGVTSLADLGAAASMEVVDKALRDQFQLRFGATHPASAPIPDADFARPAIPI